MTAFASASLQGDWGMATWELRSVNHRYLDVHFRSPESLAEGEIAWRKLIAKKLQRGKVDCQLNFLPGPQFAPTLNLNQPLLMQLIEKTKQLQNLDSCFSSSANPFNYLKWPGVVTSEKQNISDLLPVLSDSLNTALDALVLMRQREGSDIRDILQAKLEEVINFVEQSRAFVPNSLAKQKEKFEQRLEELIQVNPERLEQEMVIFASKWDIEEELDRLLCHAQEVQKQLTLDKGPKGRRLDFLMQELNREANTLASKSQDAQLSSIAVDLKVIIEQMREQVQNVE
tara:strand:- start:44268 stop:45125 length:858 start_codon:yes stop_codon:yes gene_type:complete